MANKQSEPADLLERLSLSRFVENPENPQTVTDEAFDRLVGKLRRVPDGLTAHRIAYVTDIIAGKFVVLSGNKRLRALKHVFGENYLAPVEWFQDITRMTDAERREFIIDANVNEGEWDVEKLLEQYDRDELGNLFDAGDLSDLLTSIDGGASAAQPSDGEKPSGQVIAPNQEIDTGSFEDKMTLKIELPSSKYEAVVAKLREICADDLGKALTEALHV